MDNLFTEIKLISKMEKVFLNGQSHSKESVFDFFQNETVVFQVHVTTQSTNLYFFKLKIKTDLPCGFKLYRVKHVPVELAAHEPSDDYFLSKLPGIYPDALVDATDDVIHLGKQGATYFLVSNQDVSKTGKYFVELEACSDQSQSHDILKIDFCVKEGVLPPLSIINTNWIHYDSICHAHNVAMFSDEFYQVFESYLQLALDIGIITVYVPLVTPPLDTRIGGERLTAQLLDVNVLDGNYIIGTKKLERFITFCKAKGITHFEIGHLFSQWGAKATPKVMANVDGEEKRIFGFDTLSSDKNYAKFLSAALPKAVEIMENLNVIKNTICHISDEPQADAIGRYRECCNTVRPYLKGIPLCDAMSHVEFCEQKLTDLPFAEIDFVEPFIAKEIANFAVYYCCCPYNRHYTNRFISMPSMRTRALGVMLYLSKAKGFLHWGYNFYNTFLSATQINPYEVTDAINVFAAGDSFVVYPDTKNDKALPSIRALMMQQAMLDYRKLQFFEEKMGREAVVQLFEKFHVSGFNKYPHNDNWIDDIFRNL